MIRRFIKKILYVYLLGLLLISCNNFSSSVQSVSSTNSISSNNTQLNMKYSDIEEYQEGDIYYEMKESFWNEYAENGRNVGKVEIKKDYGIYNGCRIVFITAELAYFSAQTYSKVDGKLFIFSSSFQPSIYINKEFYSLNDAFKENLLSSKDIEKFYNDYYNLTEDSDNTLIIEHLYNADKYEEGTSGLLSSYENILIYYGEYSNVEVLMFGYEYRLSQKQEETEEKVSNYSFIYYNDLSIKVCDNGRFYSLKDAYDQKKLTDDEIKDIYDIHQEKYMKIFETTEK